jgi:hypothetical protein
MCSGGLTLLVAAGVAGAQPAPATESQNPAVTQSSGDWQQRTEARLRQLEQENAELRSKVDRVAETRQAVMKDAQSRGLLWLEGGQPRLTTPDFFDVNKYVSEGDFPG